MPSQPAPKGKPSRPRPEGARRSGSPGGRGKASPQGKGKAAAKQPAAEGGRKRPVGVREELEEMQQVGGFNLWLRERLRETPAWVTSAAIHALVLIILALITLAPDIKKKMIDLVSTNEEQPEEEKIEELTQELEMQELDVTNDVVQEFVDTDNIQEEVEISTFDQVEAAPIAVELVDFSKEHAPASDLLNTIGSTTGKNPLGGRGKAARSKMVAEGGGNAASENAVALGLKWLASKQLPDGSWSFEGPYPNPGTVKSKLGATGFALMCFLGAGQTHKEGKYKNNVYRGLQFLTSNMKVTAAGGDCRGNGGNLYCHGLCAISLCEAYALTQDRSLMAPAQASVNFIVSSQDKTGGGWRYTPNQAGDTSVVGWQVMALKSAHLAYLAVPKKCIAGAINFLNLVQMGGAGSSEGAYYGYTGPAKRPATSAIGLLCRMYLGWKKDEPALAEGVNYLSGMGPSKNNMYYNYYATQVLHHWQGEQWKKWNEVMRDQLVNTQEKNGAEAGSWKPHGGHAGERGGRLYETAMCIMTLEIYYRYLPLYKEQAGKDDFEL